MADFEILNGNPSTEEIAALVAVLRARRDRAPIAPAPTRSAWNARHVHPPVIPGPDAWRRSALPR